MEKKEKKESKKIKMEKEERNERRKERTWKRGNHHGTAVLLFTYLCFVSCLQRGKTYKQKTSRRTR